MVTPVDSATITELFKLLIDVCMSFVIWRDAPTDPISVPTVTEPVNVGEFDVARPASSAVLLIHSPDY
jgi:hypothetical protein